MNKLWSLLAVSVALIVACGTSAGIPPIAGTPPAIISDAQASQPETVVGNAASTSPAESPVKVAGAPVAPDVSPVPDSTKPQTQRETIVVDISLYLVVDDVEAPNTAISTHRTEDDLREILTGINEIWSQADIRFEPQFVGAVEVPETMLARAVQGDLQTFFAELGNSFTVPQLSTINAFYVRNVGGPNGINPFRSRTFFVIDEPSVHDRRVSSHEIGHIFGLHHARRDRNRLLFSGTNGMTLTEEEATVARYVAQGILDGVR